MEYGFYIFAIIMLLDLESKVSKIIKNNLLQNKKNIDLQILKELIGKNVSIIIKNDEINNSYLFSSQYNTKGVIKDYNNSWILFQYKNKKETINQYFRIADITSINEIKDK